MNEQNPLEVAQPLAVNVKLKQIHLWHSACSRALSFKAKKAEISLAVSMEIIQPAEVDVLSFACKFKITAVDADSSREAFSIEACFCVVYDITNGYRAAPEEIEALGLSSAILNSWPYVRENVQSATAKMDLPVYTLPTISIGQLAKMPIKLEESQPLC